MGTCELCGIEGTATRRSTVHGTILDCCTNCIDSMGLVVERKVVQLPDAAPESHVVGKGISGVDIMTKDEIELIKEIAEIKRKDKDHSLSVSYTHLTLPTNREV